MTLHILDEIIDAILQNEGYRVDRPTTSRPFPGLPRSQSAFRPDWMQQLPGASEESLPAAPGPAAPAAFGSAFVPPLPSTPNSQVSPWQRLPTLPSSLQGSEAPQGDFLTIRSWAATGWGGMDPSLNLAVGRAARLRGYDPG